MELDRDARQRIEREVKAAHMTVKPPAPVAAVADKGDDLSSGDAWLRSGDAPDAPVIPPIYWLLFVASGAVGALVTYMAYVAWRDDALRFLPLGTPIIFWPAITGPLAVGATVFAVTAFRILRALRTGERPWMPNQEGK